MDIKDIALKHAREYLTFKLGGRKGCDVEEIVGDDEIYAEIVNELADQFEALVAEIQRRGEPVYQVCKSDSVSLSSAWIDVDSQTYNDAGLYPEYGRRILYTLPPSIEALEDKVAEACADLYEYGYSDPAKAMKQGEWKKFRKGE